MIDLALRFDDPSAVSDHRLESKILGSLAAAAVPLTIAVVPFRQRNGSIHTVAHKNVPHLIEAHSSGIVEVALHGYSHEPRRTDSPCEFTGLNSMTQSSMLRESRNLLTQLFAAPIRGLVPPFNSYDEVTASSAETLGFDYLSAGWQGTATANLVYLPRTCHVHELRQAVSEARANNSLSPIIVAVMHHYDFAESGHSSARLNAESFRELVHWLAMQGDIRPCTLSTIADQWNSAQSRAAFRRRLNMRRLPWPLQSRMPRLIHTAASWPTLLRSALVSLAR